MSFTDSFPRLERPTTPLAQRPVRKRHSGCLSVGHPPSWASLPTGTSATAAPKVEWFTAEDERQLASSNFRKSRRFASSGSTELKTTPFYPVTQEEPFRRSGSTHRKRSGRRNSLQAPKSTWPGVNQPPNMPSPMATADPGFNTAFSHFGAMNLNPLNSLHYTSTPAIHSVGVSPKDAQGSIQMMPNVGSFTFSPSSQFNGNQYGSFPHSTTPKTESKNWNQYLGNVPRCPSDILDPDYRPNVLDENNNAPNVVSTPGPVSANVTYLQHSASSTPPTSIDRSDSNESKKSFSKRGAWTKEEDALLIEHGGIANTKNWTEISEKIPGRSAKQCRERWCFNLDPTIKKEGWSPEEDMLLVLKQASIGNKWAQIAQLLPGRTENAVKTRYKSIVRARRREWRPAEDQLLLQLYRSNGPEWELIAGMMEPHRTKHAVKMRFKELQIGIVLLKLPEWGSSRQTVRESYYPRALLPKISEEYKLQAKNPGAVTALNSSSAFSGMNTTSNVGRNIGLTKALDLKKEVDSFDQTFDDFFNMFTEDGDNPLVAA